MSTLTLAALQSPDEDLNHQDPASRNYRHLERCRRVRIGPSVTVVFEDRQTLEFRMQELAGVARQSSPVVVRKELDWYTRLLPTAHRLVAAIWISVPGRRLTTNAEVVRQGVTPGRLTLRSDDGHEIIGSYLNEKVSDKLIGQVRWAEFTFTDSNRYAFLHGQHNWHLEIESAEYHYLSEVLSPSMLESLSADMR